MMAEIPITIAAPTTSNAIGMLGLLKAFVETRVTVPSAGVIVSVMVIATTRPVPWS